jgi:hypothetical protein
MPVPGNASLQMFPLFLARLLFIDQASVYSFVAPTSSTPLFQKSMRCCYTLVATSMAIDIHEEEICTGTP